MDKKEKTLRKLIATIPDELKGPWKFDASNVGQGWTSEYGIINPNGSSLGINVYCRHSFRQNVWRTDPRINDSKLGNILAAYVAACSPAVIETLLLEVEQLRDQVGSLEYTIEKARGQ